MTKEQLVLKLNDIEWEDFEVKSALGVQRFFTNPGTANSMKCSPVLPFL